MSSDTAAKFSLITERKKIYISPFTLHGAAVALINTPLRTQMSFSSSGCRSFATSNSAHVGNAPAASFGGDGTPMFTFN